MDTESYYSNINSYLSDLGDIVVDMKCALDDGECAILNFYAADMHERVRAVKQLIHFFIFILIFHFLTSPQNTPAAMAGVFCLFFSFRE